MHSTGPWGFWSKDLHPSQSPTLLLRNSSWPTTGPQQRPYTWPQLWSPHVIRAAHHDWDVTWPTKPQSWVCTVALHHQTKVAHMWRGPNAHSPTPSCYTAFPPAPTCTYGLLGFTMSSWQRRPGLVDRCGRQTAAALQPLSGASLKDSSEDILPVGRPLSSTLAIHLLGRGKGQTCTSMLVRGCGQWYGWKPRGLESMWLENCWQETGGRCMHTHISEWE